MQLLVYIWNLFIRTGAAYKAVDHLCPGIHHPKYMIRSALVTSTVPPGLGTLPCSALRVLRTERARTHGALRISGSMLALALGMAGGYAQNMPNNGCVMPLAANQFTVGTSCNEVPFSTSGYSPTMGPVTCGGGMRDDGFGWFTATGTSTIISYTPTTLTFGTLVVLHVYSGTCAAPVELGCASGGAFYAPVTVTVPTTVGANYFFRVQRYNSNSTLNGDICIYSPPPPLPTTGDCLYTLVLHDASGDGWEDFWGVDGTSTVEIKIDGTSYGMFTQTFLNGTLPITFGVNDGQVVDLTYFASGPSQTENSYSLTSCADEPLFSSGSPPAPGHAYGGTVACPTFAGPADCEGAVTICSSTPSHYTNAISSSGCTATDINASNDGCITSEGVGTWYYFSPQTPGTIGFTITPSGLDDYDFSLWGPYDTPAHCPNNAPIRCSTFAPWLFEPYYSTGIGTPVGYGMEASISVGAGDVGKFYVLYIENATRIGQDFTLNWNLGGGASLDCAVLPVELLSFEASTDDRTVVLAWSTASEQNAHHFDVQRSADNAHYATIGTLAAVGNAQFRNDYSFVDGTPLQGANYYRLEQVDQDGTFQYSETVVAHVNTDHEGIVLFPNPTKDALNVSFTSPMNGSSVLSIRDALGRTIRQTAVATVHGTTSITLPTRKLERGWYTLNVALPDGSVIPGEAFLRR